MPKRYRSYSVPSRRPYKKRRTYGYRKKRYTRTVFRARTSWANLGKPRQSTPASTGQPKKETWWDRAVNTRDNLVKRYAEPAKWLVKNVGPTVATFGIPEASLLNWAAKGLQRYGPSAARYLDLAGANIAESLGKFGTYSKYVRGQNYLKPSWGRTRLPSRNTPSFRRDYTPYKRGSITRYQNELADSKIAARNEIRLRSGRTTGRGYNPAKVKSRVRREAQLFSSKYGGPGRADPRGSENFMFGKSPVKKRPNVRSGRGS